MSKERASELEYLRFFKEKVYPCLGPADDDIVQSINEQFKKETGKRLPEGYYDPAEEKEQMQAQEECDDTMYQWHTFDEFRAAIQATAYTDDDGHGYFADDSGNEMKDVYVLPSTFEAQIRGLDSKWTRVHWYNK